MLLSRRSFAIVRKKLAEWAKRYLPAEVAGTAAALSIAWLTLRATDSLAAAALAGVIAENIGYYGVICSREGRRQWHKSDRYAGWRRFRVTAGRTLRTVGIEFGIAEALDSLLVRPALFYAVPMLLPGNTALAFLLAKLSADLVFYGWAIIAYEYMRRASLQTRTEQLGEA